MIQTPESRRSSDASQGELTFCIGGLPLVSKTPNFRAVYGEPQAPACVERRRRLHWPERKRARLLRGKKEQQESKHKKGTRKFKVKENVIVVSCGERCVLKYVSPSGVCHVLKMCLPPVFVMLCKCVSLRCVSCFGCFVQVL